MIVTEIYYFTKLNLQRIIFKIMFTTGILNLLMAYFLVKLVGIKGAFLSNTLTLLFTVLMFKRNHKR
jgi:O-antigen/teichoic acid export membrane protein